MKRLLPRLWAGKELLWFLAISLGIVAFWPKAPYNPVVLEKLACVAGSVAMQQHLFARSEAGQSIPPAITAAFDDRFNRLQAFMRSLRRSDDRHIQAFRPIMIKAEAARDAAVATDADAYLALAWAELQTCDDALFRKAAA